MAKPTETSSTKSSKLSSTAASLKKKVKSGTKAVTQPFKKLKQAIFTSTLTHSMHSRSSRAFSLSDNEADESNTESAANHGSVHGNNSGPEEIMLEEELHTYFHFYLASNADHFLTLEALKQTWCSPIYTFFKLDVTFQYHEGQPCHVFTCVALKCKSCAKTICHFQDLKDKASTANLRHHALHCFGSNTVNAAVAGKQAPECNNSIWSLFTWKGKQPVKYWHWVHTNPEFW